MERSPGQLIGRGRHADVFELTPGRVLRRYRTAQSAEPEAAVMEHVRAHGYPAPEVFDVEGGDLVLARVDGPSLLEIAAPPSLPTPFGRGDRVLHLDLQPANIVITEAGPVVLDWGWAAAGPAEFDPAHTWLQTATSEVPGAAPLRLVAGVGRRLLIRRFLGHFERPALTAALPEVADYRLVVRELTSAERPRIPAFVSRVRARP